MLSPAWIAPYSEPASNLQNNTEQLTFAADLPSECSSQAFRRDLWNTSLPRKSFAKGKWLKRKELNYQGRSCAMPDPGVSRRLLNAFDMQGHLSRAHVVEKLQEIPTASCCVLQYVFAQVSWQCRRPLRRSAQLPSKSALL